MNQSSQGGAGGEELGAIARQNSRRRITPLLHLPTWSRLVIATKQRVPAGAGGDFFEVVQHRDGRVTTFMADVCGNGPTAAVPVPGMRWMLRQRLARGEAPAELLAALNDWLVEQMTEEPFVTAVCVRVDPVTGETQVASAGHLGPFVKRAGGRAEVLPLVTGLALGIIAGQTYPELTEALAPEDAIVLATDGITDRMATADDPLGAAGLLDHLARARHGAESICAALLGPAVPNTQDSTVVVMQLPRRNRRTTPPAQGG
jgi:serine phosphatase RsbU (regulator of sigma subunit)